MSKRVVLGVAISSRVKEVPEVQRVLTDYGCNIRTRIGMHEVAGEFCAPSGVVLLDMIGDPQDIEDCQERLNAIEGVQCQKMEFDL